jgi:hypothetical protein
MAVKKWAGEYTTEVPLLFTASSPPIGFSSFQFCRARAYFVGPYCHWSERPAAACRAFLSLLPVNFLFMRTMVALLLIGLSVASCSQNAVPLHTPYAGHFQPQKEQSASSSRMATLQANRSTTGKKDCAQLLTTPSPDSLSFPPEQAVRVLALFP